MKKKHLLLFFLIFLSFKLTSQATEALFVSHQTESAPVAFKGRFRPMDAYARLWLHDFYHRQHINPHDLSSFPHLLSNNAIELIWFMDFLGHESWDHSPLFYVENEVLIQHLGGARFYSYAQLMESLKSHSKSNLQLIKPLIAYHAIKKYRETPPSKRSQSLDLSSLTPGLQVNIDKDRLNITKAPDQFPWQFLKPTMLIETDPDKDFAQIEKDSRLFAESLINLLTSIRSYEQLTGHLIPSEVALEKKLLSLQESASPKEIAQMVEAQFPLKQRLLHASTLLKILPSRYEPGLWFPLKALKIKAFDPISGELKLVENFTSYPNDRFDSLRFTYTEVEKAVHRFIHDPSQENQAHVRHLHAKLMDLITFEYEKLIGKPYAELHGNHITYPSVTQLDAERLYYHYPWIEMTILAYGFAFLCFLLGFTLDLPRLRKVGFFCLFLAFFLNTFLLGLRSYILGRPPVSNMYETALYVSWVSVCISLFFWMVWKRHEILCAASLAACILLVILHLADLSTSLENVQAVLNSHYWLIVHVLMVVGSYGAFILSGTFGHLYLYFSRTKTPDTPIMQALTKFLLQSMYVGTALLIPGTILGGVWAAESWGRFWDWDPKESWAFISSCVYLVFIHAYRFHYIQDFGLAIGSIIGLQAITFTWYGVNYILGTGLHTYGFGSGGELFYFLFVGFEVFFILAAITIGQKPMNKKII